METPVPPEVVAPYPGVDFTVPATVITPVHPHGAAAPRMRLGEALVAAGIISPEQLEGCLEEQRRFGTGRAQDRRLGAIIVARGLATEVDIAAGLAEITGFALIDPTTISVPPSVARLVPRALAAALRVMPLEAGPTWVRVVAADPFDRRTVEAIREATGRTSVSLAVATPASVLLALAAAWDPAFDDDNNKLAEQDTVAEPTVEPPASPVPPLATQVAEPGAATVEGSLPRSLPPTGPAPAWELCFVGDDMPSSHPGYTPDLARLESRLTALGAEGWEPVSMVTGSRGLRVLLKRALAGS